MGKKLYEETQEGGICFKSERRPWEVRIPNYVYDLWMPVLGVVDIGVYNVYCRLEREKIVKAISLETIARACRIGKSRLYDINKRLEKCGFIRVTPPEGWQRLAHYTTEITVLDPPQEVPAWAIKEYCQLKGGYQPLSPWLVQEDETQVEPAGVPNGTSGETGQDAVKDPNGTPNVVTLGLKPLGVEIMDVEADFFIKNPKPLEPTPDPGGGPQSVKLHLTREKGKPRVVVPDEVDRAAIEAIIEQEEANPTPWDLARATAAARAEAGNWADPTSFALADRLITAACARLGRSEPTGKKRHNAVAFFEKALKGEGLLQGNIDILEQAVKDWLDPEGEYAFFLSQYDLNPKHELALRHFGIVLSKAKARADARPADRYARTAELAAESQAALAERKAMRVSAADLPDQTPWNLTLDCLRAQVGQGTFNAYYRDTRLLSLDDGTAVVQARDGPMRDFLQNRAEVIGRELGRVLERAVEVRFEVGDETKIS